VAGRAAVIGTGLIGGSIGLALGADYEVVGWDWDGGGSSARELRDRRVAASIDDAVRAPTS
jgi:prephenate dehydrogenase